MGKIDWSKVQGLAEEYMSDLRRKDITNDELYEYEAHIFEAVIEAVYGKDIWDKINPILEKL